MRRLIDYIRVFAKMNSCIIAISTLLTMLLTIMTFAFMECFFDISAGNKIIILTIFYVAFFLLCVVYLNMHFCKNCNARRCKKDIIRIVECKEKTRANAKMNKNRMSRNDFLKKKIEELEHNYEITAKFKKDVKFVNRELKRLRSEIDLYKNMLND